MGIFALILAALGSVGAMAGMGGGGSSSSGSTPAAPATPSSPAAPSAATAPPPAAPEDDPDDEPDTPVASDPPADPPAGGGAPDPTPPATGGGTSTPDGIPDSAYNIGWSGLTDEEQLIVELVNRARLDPNDEVARLSEGIAPGATSAPKQALAVTRALSEASREHSQDMDNRDFFDHTNPDGQSPADRAIEEGHGSRFTGENIGWIGSSFTGFDQQSRAEAHHENLWESDGHQVNLLRDFWTEIGVGYDYGSYRGLNGSTFVTEMFGDRGNTYLTGVVIEDEDGDDFYDLGEGQGDVRITAYRGDEIYTTATWDAGGYSLALPSGTFRVVFEGGDLDAPYETDVTIGDENVKLDVVDPGSGGGSAMALAFVEDDTVQLTLSDGPENQETGLSDLIPNVPVTEENAEPVPEEDELEAALV
ncbi:MAG: CAP domain-containing protein [Pseudomonadota bacterium]